MALSAASREELSWWIDNVHDLYNQIGSSNEPDVVITSDASLSFAT